MIKINKIFIVHYKPLTERKKYLIDKLNNMKIINYEFIENYDRNSTSKEIMNEYFKLDNLNPAQICITIAHISIYKKIVNENLGMCLILEDDAIFDNNFVVDFNKYIDCCPDDIDIGSLNDGCQFHANQITSEKIWYKNTITRTCCAYLITQKCCEKILKTIIPFNKAIDHELNHQINIHNLNIYWAEPTIVTEGSDEKYKSSYIQY